MLLNDNIEATDFRAVEMEADREIQVLESKISELRSNAMSTSEVEKTLDLALLKLTALDTMYFKSNHHYGKRKLIGSIYPKKLIFEDLKARTAKQGEVFKSIYLINSKLKANKKGTTIENSTLSQEVIPLVQNSNFLLEDLKLLSDLLAA